MTATQDLDSLCRATPSCAGIALLTGEPLALVAQGGAPTAAGWASWAEAVEAAVALRHEPPIACSEAMLRSSQALVLLESRPEGVVVVVMSLGKATAGLALAQARVAAGKAASSLPAAAASGGAP
jgi:hypothetical protein